jgi:hypothetical protein
MSKNRKLIVCGTAIVAATVVLVFTLPHGDDAQASQDGQRGFWTASQKAQAHLVLTSAPVSESGALADCVIAQVSQEHTYPEFQEYAKMAKVGDFSNPSALQRTVIYDLIYDAMTCPEGS